MNNETKYESIINGIDEVIYEKIDVDSCTISIEISLEIVEFMQKSLENLRDYKINR